MSWRKFWIRKDREDYFLGGVIIACTIGGFVSSYWHFNDRITVRKEIKLKTRITQPAEQRKLRDTQFTPVKRGTGSKQYYKLEDDSLPAVPKLGEDD